MEALAGKLTARAAGTGFSWLGTSPTPKPEEPKNEEPPVAPQAPAPAVAIAVEVPDVEEIQMETAPVNEVHVVAIPPEEPAQPESELPATGEPMSEEVKLEPAAEGTGDEGKPDSKEWVPLAAANERSLSKMLKHAGDRIGWTLTIQTGAFVAFCVLSVGQAPLSGFNQFLLGSIPVLAMALLCAGLANCHATQLMLDKLESERLDFQRRQPEIAGPGSLTNFRRFAHWPLMAILAILLVVWLCLGLTVWFL